MRLLSRLEAKQKSGAIRYLLFRQSPKAVFTRQVLVDGSGFGLVPDTRMAFAGIERAQERADLIAYLRTLSDKPLALPPTSSAEADSACEELSADAKEGQEQDWQGLPPGPGREVVFYSCNACHSLKLVTQQGMSRERWDETLEWMVEEQGMAEIEDAVTRDLILDYLSTHFGSG